MNKQKWSLIGFGALLLLVLAVGLRIGGRWYVVKRAVARAGSPERVANVPVPLDLSSTAVPAGSACRLGFAEFVVPGADSVRLERRNDIILGQAENLFFAVLPPHDPASPGLALPERSAAKGSAAAQAPRNSGLDHLIEMENTVELPLTRLLFMRRTEFSLYVARLTLKGSHVPGSEGVYTFTTGQARGLVLIGFGKKSPRRTLVMLESRTGRIAAGITFQHLPLRKQEAVIDYLKPILASFRFTVAQAGSEADIRALVTAAGVKSQARTGAPVDSSVPNASQREKETEPH